MKYSESLRLSSRGRGNVDIIWPRIKDAVKDREGQRDGENRLIDLTTAENWLLRPELMRITRDAIEKDFREEHLSYPLGFRADLELADALANFFNNSSHFAPREPIKPHHVAVAPGASTCLDALLYNICDSGDGVLVPAPFWSAFNILFRNRSSVTLIPVHVDTIEHAFTPKLIEAMQVAVNTAWVPVKAVVLVNPHNPLAQCYPEELLKGLLKFCGKNGIHLISDEVYGLSLFDAGELDRPAPFVSVLSLDAAAVGCDPSLVHMVWSTSKDFGSSGLRLGCTISQYNQPMIIGHALASFTQTSSLSAVATTRLLTHPDMGHLLQLNSDRLLKSYKLITTFLKSRNIPYIPATAGVFVFAKLAPHARTWDDEAAVIAECKKQGVLVNSGRGYNMPDADKGWARITFAVQESHLREGIKRMEKAFRNLGYI